MNITFPLLAGTFAALLHVISGPDHLAAVTPLAMEVRKKAWRIGLFWGLGHLIGMLLIGVLFLVFQSQLPMESISLHSEQLIGLVLVLVGILFLYKIFRDNKQHSHVHLHTDSEGEVYAHVHNHDHNSTSKKHEHTHGKEVQQNIFSALSIGLLHGLAGVAHFILLLPVLSFKTQFEGLKYVVGFAIGTILAMMVYTFILSLLVTKSKKQASKQFFNSIRFTGALFSLVVGFVWLYLKI